MPYPFFIERSNMYKCDKCGQEYSRQVMPLHYKDCKIEVKLDYNNVDYSKLSFNELRVLTKGLDVSKNPSKQEMIDALKGVK
jgi:hypothetical protein